MYVCISLIIKFHKGIEPQSFCTFKELVFPQKKKKKKYRVRLRIALFSRIGIRAFPISGNKFKDKFNCNLPLAGSSDMTTCPRCSEVQHSTVKYPAGFNLSSDLWQYSGSLEPHHGGNNSDYKLK